MSCAAARSSKRRITLRDPVRDFRTALVANPPAIIAEIKQASPSKGQLVDNFDAGSMAKAYAHGGAAALSVLTDREFFRGKYRRSGKLRAAVCTIPVLRKDFTIDEISCARSRGAWR